MDHKMSKNINFVDSNVMRPVISHATSHQLVLIHLLEGVFRGNTGGYLCLLLFWSWVLFYMLKKQGIYCYNLSLHF